MGVVTNRLLRLIDPVPRRDATVDTALAIVCLARDTAGIAELAVPLAEIERTLREHGDQPEVQAVARILTGAQPS